MYKTAVRKYPLICDKQINEKGTTPRSCVSRFTVMECNVGGKYSYTYDFYLQSEQFFWFSKDIRLIMEKSNIHYVFCINIIYIIY